MNIVKATNQFERWLGQHIPVVKRDLSFKHQHMAETPLSFLRATFYRWMQVWPEACHDLNKAPRVLSAAHATGMNFVTT